MSDADQGEVTRRLLIGLAGVAAFIAVGLIPEKESRPKPTKPLFFYLVPLLRIQVRRICGVCGFVHAWVYGLCVHRSVGVWVCVCTDLWVYGSVGVRICGCTGLRVYGYVGVQVCG
jgi:hypothetical protein